MTDKTLFIINPNSGEKTAGAIWPDISTMLKTNDIHFLEQFTEKRNHAVEIVKSCIESGYRKIMVVGGDGTLNEVVNGIFVSESGTENITLGMIPVGTGNDWCRNFGYSTISEFFKYYPYVMKIQKNDAGVIYYGKEFEKKRFFLNVAGIGFDADVAIRVDLDKQKNRTGKLTYLKNLFLSLIKSEIINYEIMIDDKKINSGIFSMAVGIGKYNGGGMMQLPNAKTDDGLLDITLIKNISKTGVIREVKNLYDGSFIRNKAVSLFSGKYVEVTSEKEVFFETDGEVIGKLPVKIEVLPSCLNILVPDING